MAIDKVRRLIEAHLSPLIDRRDFVKVFLNERQHLFNGGTKLNQCPMNAPRLPSRPDAIQLAAHRPEERIAV